MRRGTTRPGLRAEPPLAALRCSRARLIALLVTGIAALLGSFVAPPAARAVAAPAVSAPSPGTTWTNVSPASSPPGRRAATMAFDQAHNQMVLFGGTSVGDSNTNRSNSTGAGGLNDTWTWSGTAWTQVQAGGAASSTQPSARSDAVLAYDPATAQLVLFGGIDASGTRLNDAWTWSGSAWTQVQAGGAASSSRPSARSEAMLEWDGATGQLVLFGGTTNGSAYLNDTWTWTGTGWAAQNPAGALPAGRGRGTLTYSPGTGQLVLFGGTTNGTAVVNDTWLWTGTAWQSRSPASSPSARSRHTTTYDPYLGRITMVAGCANTGCKETWSWTGTTWRVEAPARELNAREYHVAVYDPRIGKLVVFGGANANGVLADTWTLAPEPPTARIWLKASTAGPSGRAGQVMAFDGATGQLVLFGGYTGAGGTTLLNDTWVWNGTAWTNVTPAGTSPPPRKWATTTYDPETGQLLLFGGKGASGALADTWSWDGAAWTNVTPADPNASPSARYGASTAYDPSRGQLLLFGGMLDANTPYADTWDWTGSSWTQLASSSSNTTTYGRGFVGLTYDAAAGQMLLQGGWQGTTHYSGTFAWNGSSWPQVGGNDNGALRQDATSSTKVFDPVLGRTVLWDSRNAVTSYWDGSVWTSPALAAQPPSWAGDGTQFVDGDTSTAYDRANGQIVLFGGWNGGTAYATDTWVLGFQPELSSPNTAGMSTTLSGYDQTSSVSRNLEVEAPATGGWNVTVSADRVPTTGSGASQRSLPPLVVTNGTATSRTDTGAIAPTCVSTCAAPSPGTTTTNPVTVPTSGSALLYSAASGTGIGRLTMPIQIWSTIPANTLSATGSNAFSSTLTVTVSTGP